MKIFKKLKLLFQVTFIMFVIVGILIVLNDKEGATARVVDETKPMIKEAAQDINDFIGETGIKDKVKEEASDAKEIVVEYIKNKI